MLENFSDTKYDKELSAGEKFWNPKHGRKIGVEKNFLSPENSSYKKFHVGENFPSRIIGIKKNN